MDVNQNHDGHQQVVVNWLRVGIYPWYTFDHTFMNVSLKVCVHMCAHICHRTVSLVYQGNHG